MKYHVALASALGPLAAGGYHPVVFRQPKTGAPQWPAIRGVRVGGETLPDICGNADDDTDTPRVQIDIVSSVKNGYPAHEALRIAVRAAMLNFPVPALVELELEQPVDEETETFRTLIDYSLHGSN